MSQSELKGQLDLHLAEVRRCAGRARLDAAPGKDGHRPYQYHVEIRNGASLPASAFVTGLELEDLRSWIRELKG